MSLGKLKPPSKPTERGFIEGELTWHHTGTDWQGYFEWRDGEWSDFCALYPERYNTEDEVSAEEKLEKVLDLLHPGHWGTFDYRREAILKVIGSDRSVWDTDPYEEARNAVKENA